MARYLVDDPDLQAYARWMMTRMTRREIEMARVMRKTFGRYTRDCFEIPVRNHASAYARSTEGAVQMIRREHYDAAASTICAMIERGELVLPDTLPQSFVDAT